MNVLSIIVALISIVLFAQSLFSLYLMLYSWEHPERLEASSGPSTFLPPRLSFSVLLPARHEEPVIYQTIKRLLEADYPKWLMEVIVICHVDDTGTIAEAERAKRELSADNLRVATFVDPPINKPHGLNVGLDLAVHDVITVFDAEDDIDSSIFNVVNTVMLNEQTEVVQAGVQLMNFRDHWFSVHNCLEYFFWFKSRLHFHAKVGMIPLGGNTVFIRRELLARIGGWDADCLTEDADIGLRLSGLGVPVRVVYDAQHVTREETPDSLASFIRQRTRWHQGFIQILRKGTWRSMPGYRQRLLALYTLSYPLFQALLMLLWPLTIAGLFVLKLPVGLVLLSFLPLYALAFQFVVTEIGVFRFTREYGFKVPLLMPIVMAITFLPYQFALGISAVRAVYREILHHYNWEKTAHLGAHRQPGFIWSVAFQRLLDQAGARLGIDRGTVLVLDPAANTFSLLASHGQPISSSEMANLDGDGIADWLAKTKEPAMIHGRSLPAELEGLLTLPDLRSAIVLPFSHLDSTVGVLSVSSSDTLLDDAGVIWLNDQLQSLIGAASTNFASKSA
jgi:cellulose synthase/poly-beta-1,6-N-acetylglucosamine synthase-like glycosyltransferase